MTMQISYLKDGEAYTADNLNRPLLQLEAMIDEVKNQLNQMEGKSYLLTEGLPVDPDDPPVVGDLVYMGTDGKVRPALAVWNADADASGIVTPSDKAYVYGIVVDRNLSLGTADVMTGGSVTRSSEIAAGLVPSGQQLDQGGLWYLSDENPGKVCKASSGRPYLRIPVINVCGSVVTMTGAVPASGYHVHKVFTVGPSASWEESSGVYSYSGSSVADLSFFNWKDATFMVDGVEDYGGVFSLDEEDGSVVVKATSNPNGKTVQIYTAVPVSHDQPVVRGIRAIGSGRLHASSENGLVTIGVDGWEAEEPVPGYRDRAVSKLTDDGNFELTKVVSSLVGDGTVTVREGSNGQWIVSSAGGPFIRPVTTSLENATIATNNGALYYVFPRSRVSAVLGSVNIPAPPEGWKWVAYPFVTSAYSAVSLTATLVFSPTLDFDVTGGSPSQLPGSKNVTTTSSTGTVTGKASDGWEITAGGSAWLRVASSGLNSSDMNILSFGLWLEAVEA